MRMEILLDRGLRGATGQNSPDSATGPGVATLGSWWRTETIARDEVRADPIGATPASYPAGSPWIVLVVLLIASDCGQSTWLVRDSGAPDRATAARGVSGPRRDDRLLRRQTLRASGSPAFAYTASMTRMLAIAVGGIGPRTSGAPPADVLYERAQLVGVGRLTGHALATHPVRSGVVRVSRW